MMGDLRKKWSEAKKKFEASDFKGANGKPVIDPKKVFGSMDFGPALDDVDDTLAEFEKNQSSSSAIKAADEALTKATAIMAAYDKKVKTMEADLKKDAAQKADASKKAGILSGAILVIGSEITKGQAAVAAAKQRATTEDPTKVRKAMDAAVKKVVAGLSVVGSKPDPQTWTDEVSKPIKDLSLVIKLSSRLQQKHLKTFTDLVTPPNGGDKAAVLTQLKAAAVAIKALQTDAEKVLQAS